MNFLKMEYLPYFALAGLTISTLVIWYEARFFRWVAQHWFMKRSYFQIASTVCLVAGFLLISVIVLDPRDKEIKVKGRVKQEKTVILIDTSTSMLVEDVRPNRLEKAVLIAKHFVRKAVGHHVSVMVFADITKKLVPFTTDLDLLDARIDSVKQLRNLNAGTSIGLSIEEATRFFSLDDKSVVGNIIVITDGEDNANTEAFKVPEGINLVLIGVGTPAGGPINMRDSNGMFYGAKTERGVKVISKLNEDFFKNATKDQPNSMYVLAQSYDLPSDRILKFFSRNKTKTKEGDNVVRPVALDRWALPGLVLLIAAYLLRFLKPFSLVSLLLFTQLAIASEKDKPAIPPDVHRRINELKEGKLSQDEKINLADQLVRIKQHEMAQAIYQENFPDDVTQDNAQSYFNWATSELESGKIKESLGRYDQIERLVESGVVDRALIEKARQNIRRALAAPPQSKNEKKQNKDEKDKDKNQNQQNSGNQGQGEGGGSNSKSDSGQSKDEDKNPFDPKNSDKEDEKSADKPADDKKKDKDQKSEGDEKKDESEKTAKAKPKASPLLEQLKQDDRKLQLKLLDTSTQKRTGARKKDW
ncbi:MAG: VWA domain-containing protein [Bacteriovoracia bacterium]